MRPVAHPNVTRHFGAPADWSTEQNGECATLSIADVIGAGALPFMESLWRPDADELAALNAGGSISLGIQGIAHPVVYVSVTSIETGTPAPADVPIPKSAPLPGGPDVAAGSDSDTGTRPTGTGDRL